jgi:uncharacterized protein
LNVAQQRLNSAPKVEGCAVTLLCSTSRQSCRASPRPSCPALSAKSLRSGSDILALLDHDQTKLLARTRSGTLKLAEDGKGLAFALDVPDTSIGNDVLELAKRGDLGGMSFGFQVDKDGERWTGNKRRNLYAINLREISVVSAWPAYPETSVIARARPPLRLAMALRFLETV